MVLTISSESTNQTKKDKNSKIFLIIIITAGRKDKTIV